MRDVRIRNCEGLGCEGRRCENVKLSYYEGLGVCGCEDEDVRGQCENVKS